MPSSFAIHVSVFAFTAFAASAVACSGRPLPAPAPRTEAPSVDEARPADVAIAWVESGDPDQGDVEIRSAWVELGPDGPTARLTRAEPVIATSEGLWVIRPEDRVDEACKSCACSTGGPEGCKKVEMPVTEPWALNLSTRKTLKLGAVDGPIACEEEGINDYGASVEVHYAVGSIVFFTVHEYQMACLAAHPSFHDQPYAFDLERREAVSFSVPEDRAPSLTKRATEELHRDYDGCVLDEEEEATAYAARFAYARKGALEGRYLFTMSAAYVCSNGPGHYSVATEITDSSSVPPRLSALREAPRWMLPFLHNNKVIGVSPLPECIDRSRAFEQFSELPERRPMPRE